MIHVEILSTTTTPVQMHLASATVGNQLLHQSLDRRKTGSTGQKDRRGIAVTQIESAKGTFDRYNILGLDILKDHRCGLPTRHQTDMQLDATIDSLCSRHRITARNNILDRQIDILSRHIIEHGPRRKLAGQLDNIIRQLFLTHYTGSHFLYSDTFKTGDLRRMQHQITDRPGLAGQYCLPRSIRLTQLSPFGICHLTRLEFGTAFTTLTITAAVLEHNTGLQTGIQNTVVCMYIEGFSNRINSNCMTHQISPFSFAMVSARSSIMSS